MTFRNRFGSLSLRFFSFLNVIFGARNFMHKYQLKWYACKTKWWTRAYDSDLDIGSDNISEVPGTHPPSTSEDPLPNFENTSILLGFLENRSEDLFFALYFLPWFSVMSPSRFVSVRTYGFRAAKMIRMYGKYVIDNMKYMLPLATVIKHFHCML